MTPSVSDTTFVGDSPTIALYSYTYTINVSDETAVTDTITTLPSIWVSLDIDSTAWANETKST